MTAPALRLDGVVVERGNFAVGPVSMGVEPGEVWWLTGRNGTGKSTLLGGIAGLYPLRSGEIWIRGERVASPRRGVEPWRRDCALMLQDLGLWPHLTLRKQCQLVRRGRPETRTTRDRLTELAEALGVVEFLDRRPTALSGGQAQRAALLRTLARAAGVLLLDEPYSEQDSENVALLDRVWADLAGQGSAIVVAGHRAPPDARRFELEPTLE